MAVQSSSAGILLPLLGAAFLTTPLFGPEKAAGIGAVRPPRGGEQVVPMTVGQRVAVLGEEEAPNGTTLDANRVPLGSLTDGPATLQDYETVCVDHGEARNLLFTLTQSGGRFLDARFYHRDGTAVRSSVAVTDFSNIRLEVEQPETCVTLRPQTGGEVWYQFSVVEE